MRVRWAGRKAVQDTVGLRARVMFHRCDETTPLRKRPELEMPILERLIGVGVALYTIWLGVLFWCVLIL